MFDKYGGTVLVRPGTYHEYLSFDIFGDGSGTGNTINANRCATTNLPGACG